MASFSDNLATIETPWAFRSAFQNSWICEAFDRDTEALTKALQKSIASEAATSAPAPDDSDLLTVVKTGTTSSSSGGGSEPETASKRTITRNVPPPNGKITKRKSRASKRSPTTFITADPANFRQMVQQVTGVRFAAGQIPVGSVLKPEPHRGPIGVVNRLQAGCLLPTLDTSAFLLEHLQQVGPPQSSLGFGPPAVQVAEGGGPRLDFDGFSSFPTLESWKV